MRSASVKAGIKEKRLIYVSVILLVSLIISVAFLAAVPPVSKDALTHHLAVPKLYLKHGGMYEIPYMVFSYYPMNLDLLYLIPLYFENDIFPKFIHFSFALLTAWVLFGYIKHRLNSVYALYGVIFFLSIPIIMKLSITVYVDLGLMFFCTASLILLFKWIESNFHIKFFIFSAICCGLAMGTKYNGLIVFLLFSLFVPFIYSRYSENRKVRFHTAAGLGVGFFVIALLVFSPWMIRNYIWTDNPLYPLYDTWFNVQDPVSKKSLFVFNYRRLIYHESWLEMVLLPFRIFFQGQDGNPKYFDGKLNPFLLILPLFSFYRIKDDLRSMMIEKRLLLAFVVLFFAFAFFSSELRIRYVVPIIPPLAVLSMYGMKNMFEVVGRYNSENAKRVGRIIIFGLAACSLWPNAAYVIRQFGEVQPFIFQSGAITRDEYIAEYRPEYPAMQYINSKLSTDARILFFFLGNRGYYCDREYVFDLENNRSMFHQVVANTCDLEEVSLRLKERGITHLLVYHKIFDKWVRTSFAPERQRLIRTFFKKSLKRLFFQAGYGIYAL